METFRIMCENSKYLSDNNEKYRTMLIRVLTLVRVRLG